MPKPLASVQKVEMDRPQEQLKEGEHLVESKDWAPKADHAEHADNLKECIQHDKAVPDDRWGCQLGHH